MGNGRVAGLSNILTTLLCSAAVLGISLLCIDSDNEAIKVFGWVIFVAGVFGLTLVIFIAVYFFWHVALDWLREIWRSRP